MRLIVFAHRAEAATFLKQGDFKSIESITNALYSNKSDYLLVCGEGIYSALEMVSTAIGECKSTITEVLNYGIAGSLSEKAELSKIYEIRTFYAHNNSEVEFKSYSSNITKKLDCITSSKRVLDGDFANHLSCFAHIADREAWAIARAASNANLPIRAYKLISDNALTNNSDTPLCEIIKENAEIYSDKMWKHFVALENKEVEIVELEISKIKELYLTVSQFRNYKNLLSSLLHKFPSELSVLENCCIEDIKELNLTEKQRAQKLIDKMREIQNPFNHKLSSEVEEVLRPLKKAQINIKLSKNYESDSFNVSATIHNEVELQLISNALKRFNYSRYKEILRGNIDV
jgi:nucleoside phosphorylase